MSSKDIKVGLLAYGAIGDEHSRAVQATAGLALYAVCDTNPERLTAALQISPDAKTFTDADAMLAEGEIDLVVISTPPNSHYKWAKQALSLGLHVMLEKPMALTTQECDELMELAKKNGALLVVYQNRRYDADYLTIKHLIETDQIGDLFHYESFVGGYSKPCSYWHSDAEVSGGARTPSAFCMATAQATIPAIASSKCVSGANTKAARSRSSVCDHTSKPASTPRSACATAIATGLAGPAAKPVKRGGNTGNWLMPHPARSAVAPSL